VYARRDNIRFDLLRTGSVERTTNKILERGFLDAVHLYSSLPLPITLTCASQPPAGYYTLYPRTAAATPAPGAPTARASSSAVKAAAPSLIDRYRLNERVADDTPIAPAKPAWADSPAQREASLKERKAQMVLAARQ
jgi:coupling of ubiquitin conjugation to ER degradation protein 1